MNEELKPVRCGCGGKAEVEENVVQGMTWMTRHYYVGCQKCHIETKYYDTEAEAIQAWNTAMSGNVVVYGNPDAPKSKTVG